MKLVKLGILFFTLIGFANTSVFSTSFCLNKQENQTSYHLDISCHDKSEKNDNSIICFECDCSFSKVPIIPYNKYPKYLISEVHLSLLFFDTGKLIVRTNHPPPKITS